MIFKKNPVNLLLEHKCLSQYRDLLTPYAFSFVLKQFELALEHLKCPSTSEATTMIKCYICDNLYHHNCVGITLERAKKMNAIKEMWFCIYKGCEEAFGDLFESD